MSASLVLNSGLTSVLDNTTRYLPITGGLSTASPTEDFSELGVYQAGVFSHLYVSALVNTITGTTPITLRKSGVNTSLTVSYSTGQTGAKEDTSNTATFAATDRAAYQVAAANDPSGTLQIDINIFGMVFTPTDTTKTVTFLGSARNITNITNASAQRFMAISGPPVSSTAGQAWTPPAAFTAANLRVNVSANARTTDTIISSFVGASPGNQTVTYSSGQTGVKEDTTNTDSLTAAGPTFQFRSLTSTGTETLSIRAIGCDLTSTAGQFVLIAMDGAGEALSASTVYISPAADLNAAFADTESKVQQPARMALTVSQLEVALVSNTLTDATAITFRTGGAGTALTVSFAATETGNKLDSTHSASVLTTDVISHQIVAAGAGAITFRYFSLLATVGTQVATPVELKLAEYQV